MSDLSGQVGEIRFTVEIVRKETGKTESFEMVGHSDPEKLREIIENSAATVNKEGN